MGLKRAPQGAKTDLQRQRWNAEIIQMTQRTLLNFVDNNNVSSVINIYISSDPLITTINVKHTTLLAIKRKPE